MPLSLPRGQGGRLPTPPHLINTFALIPAPPILSFFTPALVKSSCLRRSRAMFSVDLRAHTFAGNPLRCHHGEPTPPTSALESLSAHLLGAAGDGLLSLPDHKVLPFRKGRPLARSSETVPPGSSSLPAWRLGWLGPSHLQEFPADSFVYLGSGSQEDGGAYYWAVDATDAVDLGFGTADGSSFIELRTLMVATDWGDGRAMGELAAAGHPGESLEEAVRRETWEETGIEVGDVIYHSSQPWPVGPSSMPCQLMVGFLAYAKSLEIHVDKEELEDAQWHSREDVKRALTFAEYEKAQRAAARKVNQTCTGIIEKGQNLASDVERESRDLAPMFVPGPYAIAHHLISSWANQETCDKLEFPSKRSASLSNL